MAKRARASVDVDVDVDADADLVHVHVQNHDCDPEYGDDDLAGRGRSDIPEKSS